MQKQSNEAKRSSFINRSSAFSPGDQFYYDSCNALEGIHRAKDLLLSFDLNHQAALEGHADAILAMGWYYLNGVGVPADIQEAKHGIESPPAVENRKPFSASAA